MLGDEAFHGAAASWAAAAVDGLDIFLHWFATPPLPVVWEHRLSRSSH